MDELIAFYWDLLAEDPDAPASRAVAAGLEHFDRGAGSPTLAEHEAALTSARIRRDDPDPRYTDPEENRS